MSKLITSTNLDNPDAVYAAIIEAHRELSDEESAAFNARLVLLLANHIGDDETVLQALEAARPYGDATPEHQHGVRGPR